MVMTDDLGSDDNTPGVVAEDLFRRYHRPVVSFFLRRGFSVDESRDLAQETFLRVYRNRESFRGDSSIETWLFQIAANLYKNQLRTQGTLKRDREEIPLEESEAGTVALDGEGENDPLEAILGREREKLLRDALAELPPQMKKAVFLRVDGDLKYREIAEEMSVSIETVKAHLYQARQHLRDRLGNYFTSEEY